MYSSKYLLNINPDPLEHATIPCQPHMMDQGGYIKVVGFHQALSPTIVPPTDLQHPPIHRHLLLHA